MRIALLPSLVCALLTAGLQSQRYVAGVTDVMWANPTGAGTAVLDARVHYPAVTPGVDTPLAPSATAYPVVVFLHGFGFVGTQYGALGEWLAQNGLIAVMLNTAQYDPVALEADARAAYDAVDLANRQTGGFFEGAINIGRVGLMGHSMGGAVAGLVLDEHPTLALGNPGYRCGLCLAPVDPALVAPLSIIDVPMGVVSGMGDLLTPPSQHAEPFYQSLDTADGLRFHAKLDASCDHMNIAGLAATAPAVLQRVKHIAAGFFGHFLQGRIDAMDQVLGPTAVADPVLVDLSMDAVVPQCWATGPLRIGGTTRVSLAAESGIAGLIAADSTWAPIPTFIGFLLLNPNTAFTLQQTVIPGERLDFEVHVPFVPQLVGATFAVQGAGVTIVTPFQLGSAVSWQIQG